MVILATLLQEMAWYVVDGVWLVIKLVLWILPIHFVVVWLQRGSDFRGRKDLGS